MEHEPLLHGEPKAKRSKWLIILASVLIVGIIGGVAFQSLKSFEVAVADDGLHGYTEPTETLALELGDRTEEETVQQANDAAAESPPPPAAEGQPPPAQPAPPSPGNDATTGQPAAEGTTGTPAEGDVTTAANNDSTTAPSDGTTDGTMIQAGATTAAPSDTTGDETTQEAANQVQPDAQITAQTKGTQEAEPDTTHPAQANPDCSDEAKAVIHNCMTMNNASQKDQCNAAPKCTFKDEGCDFGYTQMQCVPTVAEACLYDIEIDDGDDLFAVMQPDASCPKVDSSASQIAIALATALFIGAWF